MTYSPPATYPHWLFDGSEIEDTFGYGERAVNFLRNLRHPKSALPGQRFQIDPWVERIVRRIYGPRHVDGTRKVRTVFAMVPRGNRKTTLGAALLLLHSIGPERQPGGQVVCAAADQKQARISFEEAIGVIHEDHRLEKLVDIADYRNRFRDLRTGSVVEAISADAKTQHGRTPTFTLMDELHAWPKRDLWEALKTGLIKTPGSLNVIITTAGRGQENIAFDTYDYARKVATGDIDDESWLPVIFEARPDDDWLDEEVWHAVNPGLRHGYPDLPALRQYAREAKERPYDRESFRQLNLNVWLDSSASPFLDMPVFDAAQGEIDLEHLRTLPCWLGVDLSSSFDLTSIAACWRDGDRYFLKTFNFCPADNIARRSDADRVPYRLWSDQGHIEATPGNVVDFRAVEDRIRTLCADNDVREIAFDPHMARVMMASLVDDGLPAIEMRQGWVTMAPAIKAMEEAFVGAAITHDGNPVTRWCFSNIAVETDKAGNKSFHKGKSRDRIDAAQASAMAVGRASLGEAHRSIYESPDFDPSMMVLA